MEGSYRFRDKKNIPSLFRDGKVFGLYFWSQNLEGTYRGIFRDGNLETEIFPCLNRDGNNFPSLNRDGNNFQSLNRDGNCFPSLFRDGNVFPCLNRDGNVFPCLNRDGKISVSKFPSLFFNFLVVRLCFAFMHSKNEIF